MAKRYYVRGTKIACEEDATHEFKGHRNICKEDIPPWTVDEKSGKATRKAISRALNGFLNTGKGGTVYLGIPDDGLVLGLQLNQYQKDHVVTSVDEVMTRYTPKVDPSRYKIRFTPVVLNNAKPEEIQAVLNYQAEENVDVKSRQRPHVVRTYQPCWCDKETNALLHNDILVPTYVIEITIKPWNQNDPNQKGIGKLNLHPIHADEEGRVYFRRQAGLVQYTLPEIDSMARHIVQDYYQRRIRLLRMELSHLAAQRPRDTGR